MTNNDKCRCEIHTFWEGDTVSQMHVSTNEVHHNQMEDGVSE